ncbi:hypothetical protein ACT7DE_19365 [Bacillus paranthracis]
MIEMEEFKCLVKWMLGGRYSSGKIRLRFGKQTFQRQQVTGFQVFGLAAAFATSVFR